MKRITTIIMLWLAVVGCTAAGEEKIKISRDNMKLLESLDSAINNQAHYKAEKERKIAALRGNADEMTDTECFAMNARLYDEYKVYDSDSAMKYVDMNIDIARSTGNNEWLVESRIDKAFIYSVTGLLKEAYDEIKELDVNKMTDAVKVDYYAQMTYLYSHLDQYNSNSSNYSDESYACTDSVLKYINKNHPLYMWYKGWAVMSRGEKTDNIIRELSAVVENTSNADNRTYAMNAYLLARLYEARGDMEKYLRYLAMSGLADVRICNHDMASVEELGYLLYNQGEIERAYTCLSHCFEMSQEFNNRVRIGGISKTLNEITMSLHQKSLRQENAMQIYIIVVTLLAVVLIAAIAFILRQMNRLRQSRVVLSEMNGQLNANILELSEAQDKMAEMISEGKKMNQELNRKNGELREASYLKEEYIGYVFTLCNSYIRKLDDFRVLVSRKLKVGQVDEVRRLTASTQMVEDETKAFLHEFDSFFLSLYPDFVDNFNKLLRPEEQIVLDDDEQLNTVLRIYALVRLGITDSVKIASFLHCSPQTVYNNRMKTRNKSILPKDDFVGAVQTLGKVDI